MSGSVWFTTRDFTSAPEDAGRTEARPIAISTCPYCSYEFGTRVFILSTYQSRIITIENGMATSWLSTRGSSYLDQVGLPNSKQWRGTDQVRPSAGGALGQENSCRWLAPCAATSRCVERAPALRRATERRTSSSRLATDASFTVVSPSTPGLCVCVFHQPAS